MEGIRREQADATEQIEEQEPIVQAPLSSGLSLERRLMPDGIGALEQAAYYSGRKIHESQFIFPSYLLFDLHPGHSLPYINPKYLVYAHFMLHGTIPSRGYLHAASPAEYSADAEYKAMEQPKQYLLVASSPIPYVAPLPLLYAGPEIYQRAKSNLFNAKPKVQGNDVYQSYALRLILPTIESPRTEVPVRAYAAQQPYVIFTASSAKLPQMARAAMPKLESMLMKLTIPVSYQKPEVTQIYSQEKKYVASSLSQDLNPKSNHGMQKYAPPKAGILNSTRNYDTHPKWINVPSSNFWKKATLHYLGRAIIKPNNIAAGEYKQKFRNLRERGESKRQDESSSYKREAEIKPLADKDKVTDAPKEQIKPKYEAKKSEETEKPIQDSDTKIKTDYKLKDDKKPYGKSSALAYAGAAAGIGLVVGLSSLAKIVASGFKRKQLGDKTQTERPQLQLVVSNKTIDNIITPVADLEMEDYPTLINNLQGYVKRLDELGYGKKGLVALNIKTRKPIFAYNGDIVMIEPSKNKTALVLAALYRAQHGLFDLNGTTPFRKELHLERETGIEQYIIKIDGVKYLKNKDMIDLVIKRSNNTATSHLTYALAQNSALKINQTPEEVVEQFEKGADIYESVMNILGFPEIKIKGPYLNEEKTKELKFKATYESNTTTPNATARLHASVREGDFLDKNNNAILLSLLENEETATGQRKILGEGAALKPSIHPYGAGISGSTKNISFDLGFDDSPVILYEKKVSTELKYLSRFYTPQAVRTNQLETEFIRIIKQGEIQESLKQTYKAA